MTGRIRRLELLTSRDGRSWGEARIERTLPDSGRAVRMTLAKPVSARYLKVVAWSEVNGGRGTALAEIDVLPPSP